MISIIIMQDKEFMGGTNYSKANWQQPEFNGLVVVNSKANEAMDRKLVH